MRSVLFAALLASGGAHAATQYVLTATAINPNVGLQQFSVTFEDLNENGLLSITEMISSNVPEYVSGIYTYTTVGPLYVPVIPGFTEPPNPAQNNWVFTQWSTPYHPTGPGSWGFAPLASSYSYAITLVPEPSTCALWGVGLAALTLTARRAKAEVGRLSCAARDSDPRL